MGEMSFLSSKGDDKIIWDPEDESSVENAEATFNRHIKDGWTAFEVTKKGRKTSKKVDEFDPDLAKLIFVRKMTGG